MKSKVTVLFCAEGLIYLTKEGLRDLRPNVVYATGGLSGLISVDKTDAAYIYYARACVSTFHINVHRYQSILVMFFLNCLLDEGHVDVISLSP